MATNTRQSRRDAEKRRIRIAEEYRDWFFSMFSNSVILKNAEVPKRYFLRILAEKGAIAFDRQTGFFLPFAMSGVDIYGLPTAYNLIGFNGYTVWRKPDEVVILRSNDLMQPIAEYIDLQIEKIVELDMSIFQNIEAIKTMTICEVGDQSTLLSLANLSEARQIGATIAFVNKGLNINNEMKISSTNAQFLVDKLMQARQDVINETLARLGTVTSNTEKRERVQTEEIQALNGYGFDCISVLIDTINYDAEQGGIPLRVEGNTSIFDYQTRKGDINNDLLQSVGADGK